MATSAVNPSPGISTGSHPVVQAIATALISDQSTYQDGPIFVSIDDETVTARCVWALFPRQIAEVVTNLNLMGFKPVRVIRQPYATEFVVPRLEVHESTDCAGEPCLVLHETTSIRNRRDFNQATQEAS